jgi:ATP-dependent DNA helicase RecG
MAPTEVLARQHFNQLSKDLKNIDVDLALLVGSDAMVSQKRKVSPKKIKKSLLLEKIKEGKIGLVIGTHALIQKNVSFKNLAFVVIDEQHRFGVEQRATLLNMGSGFKNQEKDFNPIHNSKFKIQNSTNLSYPHLLTMSATPIPRTLSLVFYGDLKISQIQKMPIGRKKIMTQVVLPKERPLIYEFIKKEVAKGRQVFIICPLIEESEKLQVRAVEKEFERLSRETFSDLRVSLLHGRLKSPEKKQVMEDFQSKKTDILVSTPVIEVGIDIPNASIMMIEGAERFGLAQLHQLRGRVGRGPHQSYCFLLTDVPNKNNLSRLHLITHIENGFKLAEKDLQMRGPGDFIGYRQSGLPDLVMASLSDIELIKIAKEEAEKILEKDPDLEKYPLLQKKIKLLEEKIHLE